MTTSENPLNEPLKILRLIYEFNLLKKILVEGQQSKLKYCLEAKSNFEDCYFFTFFPLKQNDIIKFEINGEILNFVTNWDILQNNFLIYINDIKYPQNLSLSKKHSYLEIFINNTL